MRCFLAVTAFLAAAVSFAQVHPSILLNTSDGGPTSLQDLINDHASVSASVGSADGSSYGDQLVQGLFTPTGASVSFEALWDRGNLAGVHRLGYYSPSDPLNITWVLGDTLHNGTITSNANAAITGDFGLVLDNGASGFFYTQKELNYDSPLVSSNPLINGFDRRIHAAILANQDPNGGIMGSYEDLWEESEPPFGVLDYNDYGFLIKNAAPVPEPGTMLVLGAGAAALVASRRRRRA